MTTALEMHQKAQELSPHAQVIIAAAAVADFRVENPALGKIKKDRLTQLNLTENPDILADLGQNKKEGQLLIGFAAESDDLIVNAQKKLKAKNLDWILANDIGQEGGVFYQDHNQIHFITGSQEEAWPRLSKEEAGRWLAQKIIEFLGKKS